MVEAEGNISSRRKKNDEKFLTVKREVIHIFLNR